MADFKTANKVVILPDLWPWLAEAQWHVLPAAVAAGLLAAFIALISGAAILRLSGIAASIATFALLAIINTVYSNWEGVTGATSSVVGLIRYADQWATLAWAVAAVVAAAIYANSSSGLALRATREDEVAAFASGINMYSHRLLSLVISGFFAGVSGALLGHSLGILNPNSFYLSVTFITLAMLVVGGIGSLTGAVFGVLVLSILIEMLVRLERGVETAGTIMSIPSCTQEILIGITMIIVLIFRPGGLTRGRELKLSSFGFFIKPKK
ncbi:MAG: branched-chain amino acid ABC transporter permease [Paraglaciecola sp.]|nr:branched-chain amino acid ABC transporter permease [Paraglaciecola sp.]